MNSYAIPKELLDTLLWARDTEDYLAWWRALNELENIARRLQAEDRDGHRENCYLCKQGKLP